jgi:predicted HNH restriction endonuclease
MNKALIFKNWNRGGRYYLLNATSDNKWVGFQESVIEKLQTKFGDEFFLLIWTDRDKENDFYNIPFKKVKHVFTEKHKTTGNYKNRWTAIILNDKFMMHSNSHLAIDIRNDYGNMHTDEYSLELRVSEDLSSYELENEYFEGDRKSRLSSYYERNAKLRIAAIKIHGLVCKVCGFDFKNFYGEHGAGFIEVHHLKPVSTFETLTNVSPGNDMTAVCSNCHRMLHRNKDRTLTPSELRELLNS